MSIRARAKSDWRRRLLVAPGCHHVHLSHCANTAAVACRRRPNLPFLLLTPSDRTDNDTIARIVLQKCYDK